MKLDTREDYRKRRHIRVRQRVKGTAERPRMCVCVSNRHMYVQFVDDQAAATLVAASTQSKELEAMAGKKTVDVAKKLGAVAAEAAIGKGIKAVVFDRGGFPYTGRIKALAEAARAAGLKF